MLRAGDAHAQTINGIPELCAEFRKTCRRHKWQYIANGNNSPVELCQHVSPADGEKGLRLRLPRRRALTYVVSQVSASGDARMSLYAFRSRVLNPLLRSFSDGIPCLTPQGQAIWVDGPTAPKQAWTIWRWTGGSPVKVLTLPPRWARHRTTASAESSGSQLRRSAAAAA
jgi:hypothetical protein